MLTLPILYSKSRLELFLAISLEVMLCPIVRVVAFIIMRFARGLVAACPPGTSFPLACASATIAAACLALRRT
jgi:hypothetical protein